MSKFVGIKTYERFRNLWENNEINEFSLNFILDTGQLYTHGIFINSAVFGTAANGAVPLSIAGVTNTLALSSHTHSNYLEKNKNIDISNNKIISGDNDLLYCNGGSLYIGNSNPTYISGSYLYHVDDTNIYTILDTGNFEITNTLASGYTYNNTALIKYGNSSHLIDYVKRINTSLSFDYLNTYTQAGTNLLNGVYYGYLTLYTDNIYTNPSWAQLRINISEKAMLYRTSADSNNWINVTDSTAVKLGTAGATNITNGSVISALSSNGIIFQGGTNSFKIGNGTSSISVSVSHGLSTKNITINGSTYALYTSASSLPSILAPTSYAETGGQVLATNTNKNGLTWVSLPTKDSWNYDDVYTKKTLAIPVIIGPSTDTTAGTWTGTTDAFSAYVDGLTIIYVPAVAGANTTTLNINGLGAKTCYFTNTNKLTTHFTVGTPIMFIYYDGYWKRADYDSGNTKYYLTLNGVVKGHSGKTDLGTFYAVATSNASEADQVWMRNSDNTDYAWRTLGSRAFDSTSYIPLSGNSTTSPITGTLYMRDTDGIYIRSSNVNKNIWHIVGGSGSWDSLYGFNLQYLGNASGNDNDLVLWAHALKSTHVEVYRVHQDGSFIFKSTPKVDTTLVSLAGHKHAYTDLTGSTTTADQAIVSSGTADDWTLKTLGSRAFDSTDYLPLTGGTMTGPIKRCYGSASNEPMIALSSPNLDVWLWRVSSEATPTATSGVYGFGLKYMGTGKGNNNRLVLFADNTNKTQVSSFTITQDGVVNFTSTPNVNNYELYYEGNIPSNSSSEKGVVPAGVASSVYMTDANKNPSWTSIDNIVTSGSSNLVTSGAVFTAIANKVAGAVQYLGTITSEVEMKALSTASYGDFARVATSFSFTDASGELVTAHVGDVVYLINNESNAYATSSNWVVAHTEIDTDTWTAASTSASGYIPKLVTGGANLEASSTDYVLAYVNGTNTPVWRKLPSNAYLNTWTAWQGATDSTDGTAGYMPAPTSAQREQFLRGDGTWVIPTNTTYKLTLNGTVKGTTEGTDLGTIWAPASKGTGFLKCTDGTWSYDNTTYATPDTTTTLSRVSGNLTKDTWMDAETFADSMEEGTWIVSFTVDSSIYSGVFSRKKNDIMSEEINLHAAGTSTKRIYARTSGNKFLIATADDTFNPGAITFNFRKLI